MAIDYRVLALAKPEPHKRVKARRKRQHAKARKSCRAARYTRDGGCCVRCGKPLKLNPSDEGADWYNVANINEKRPRSLGGDPLDPKGQNTLCAKCHTGSGRHAK
jgi:hypothetical protein